MEPTISNEVVRVYQCPKEDCGGTVIPTQMDGRFYFHRQVFINVPKDIYIPRCRNCNQDWLTKEVEAMIEGVCEAEYKLHEDLIKKAFERKKKRGEN